jgi:hypothetical protein
MYLKTLIMLFGLSLSAQAYTLNLDFNDGVAGTSVGATYAGQGATFTNAEFSNLSTGYVPDPASTGLRIVGTGQNLQPKSSNPLIVVFDQAIREASLIANNVNANGARIDAYDSPVGGNLVTFDQVVGSSGLLNSNFTLSLTGNGIRRLEFYQPFSIESEGVLFDNLQVTSVPEPNTLPLVIAALTLVLARRKSLR